MCLCTVEATLKAGWSLPATGSLSLFLAAVQGLLCVLHPCVHIHVYMNMCAHMETTSQHQVSPPCFLKQGVPGNLEPRVSSCWCLPVLPGFLTRVLQSSWLYSRCSTTEPFTQPSLLVPDSRIDAYLLALSQPLLFLPPVDSHPGPCFKREL